MPEGLELFGDKAQLVNQAKDELACVQGTREASHTHSCYRILWLHLQRASLLRMTEPIAKMNA